MTLQDALQEIFSRLHTNYPELSSKELFEMQIESFFLMVHVSSDDQVITNALIAPEDVPALIERLATIIAKLKEQQSDLREKPIPPMSLN